MMWPTQLAQGLPMLKLKLKLMRCSWCLIACVCASGDCCGGAVHECCCHCAAAWPIACRETCLHQYPKTAPQSVTHRHGLLCLCWHLRRQLRL